MRQQQAVALRNDDLGVPGRFPRGPSDGAEREPIGVTRQQSLTRMFSSKARPC